MIWAGEMVTTRVAREASGLFLAASRSSRHRHSTYSSSDDPTPDNTLQAPAARSLFLQDTNHADHPRQRTVVAPLPVRNATTRAAGLPRL